MRRFYEGYGQNYTSLQFLTPTAFKQQGNYTFYPDLRCIYQSLMNKYDSAVESETMCDEETLEQLCRDSRIVEYNLRSVKYHLEGARIPADSSAYLVYYTDNIAAAADRRENTDTEGGFDREMPLSSVFNILNRNDCCRFPGTNTCVQPKKRNFRS